MEFSEVRRPAGWCKNGTERVREDVGGWPGRPWSVAPGPELPALSAPYPAPPPGPSREQGPAQERTGRPLCSLGRARGSHFLLRTWARGRRPGRGTRGLWEQPAGETPPGPLVPLGEEKTSLLSRTAPGRGDGRHTVAGLRTASDKSLWAASRAG